MDINNLEITCGCNISQTAKIEKNNSMIDYTTSKNLSYIDVLNKQDPTKMLL